MKKFEMIKERPTVINNHLPFFIQLKSQDKKFLSFYFIITPPFLFKKICEKYFPDSERERGSSHFGLKERLKDIDNFRASNWGLLKAVDIGPWDKNAHGGIYAHKDYVNNKFYDWYWGNDFSDPRVVKVKGNDFNPKDSLKSLLRSLGVPRFLLPWVHIVSRVDNPVDETYVYFV